MLCLKATLLPQQELPRRAAQAPPPRPAPSLTPSRPGQTLHGDPRRPALLLRPAKAEGVVIRLLPTISPSTFALPRLAPDRNGVRAHARPAPAPAAAAAADPHADGHGGGGEPMAAAVDPEQLLLPTPYYNACIVEDAAPALHAARLAQALGASPRLADGLCLLKMWARRQGLMAAGCCSPPSPPSSSGAGGGAGRGAGLFAWEAVPGPADGLDGTVLALVVLLVAERNKMVGGWVRARWRPSRSFWWRVGGRGVGGGSQRARAGKAGARGGCSRVAEWPAGDQTGYRSVSALPAVHPSVSTVCAGAGAGLGPA